MDFSHLPTDYFAKSTQFTKELYYDVYPSVEPSTALLSQRGKGIAMSFAKAKASVLILAGRNKQDLMSAAAEIHAVAPEVQTDIRVIDISNEAQVKSAFFDLKGAYPRIDILINNAGSGDSPLPIVEVEVERWWYNFEVMVKGTFLMTQQFLQLNGTASEVIIINITSAAALTSTPRLSSYSVSKLCQIQLQSFVRAENPNVRAISLHPGIVMTRMTPPAFHRFARDTFELVGGVAVWLASKQAAFMNGRYISVNWSVDELLERKEEIISNGLLEVGLQGKFGRF
ncbi:oxidoreductase [Aspergillus granulosus]|uniref:Oxidoreductase n=1 Tax=Aspergillus granulosus TaxID=176169 RepID=A0ABR4GXI6_9EURO